MNDVLLDVAIILRSHTIWLVGLTLVIFVRSWFDIVYLLKKQWKKEKKNEEVVNNDN